MEFTIEERVDAIEQVMRDLLLVLESERRFTGAKLHEWLACVREAQMRHGEDNPRQQAAIERLCHDVLQIGTGAQPGRDAVRGADQALQRLQPRAPGGTPGIDPAL